MAYAQVNIDQDKSPAHIFASDCSVCHKSTRGLANGRGNSALTGFLAEHYTSSREEAAAMAAYVLASGGGIGTAAPAREQNAQGRERPSSEEPKAREARRPAKPQETAGATAKPKRTSGEHTKPEREERSAAAKPGGVGAEGKPAGERHESNTATRRRDRQKPAEVPAPASETATVAVERKPPEPPKLEISPAAPTASAAAAAQQGESQKSSPAPTDNIPD